MFEISYSISDDEIVAQYNHVHHAVSIMILEKARLALLESVGHPQDGLIKRGYFPAIISLSARYEREVRKGTVRITCDTCKIRRKIFTIEQRLINPDGEVAIQFSVDWLFMSGETKKAISPPEDFLVAMRAHPITVKV